MDLQRIAPLHPEFDPALGLLRLELEHGKANEIGGIELDAFEALCELLEADDAVRCLCTTSRRVSGRGTPIFISGANVSERVGWSDERVKLHVVRQRAIMRRLRHAPLFTVVLTHGVTFGWGTEFVLTADYCLATPTARFALPETGLGILPGARGTAELALLVGPAQALRLGCTGEELGADEARAIGLVHEDRRRPRDRPRARPWPGEATVDPLAHGRRRLQARPPGRPRPTRGRAPRHRARRLRTMRRLR
jgi:enoyl-CoA hydratase/carnithine racemase